ncbi:MAG: tetratricopeptide repeat protein, partial [Deltaproteobacteria bacterium]|nr:tetratricopeptide repeat protein [Deltaproteobacteria bacterium]
MGLKIFEIHDEASHSLRRKNIYALIVLSLLVCSIYSNSLNCSWHFDDWANIGDNPNVQLTKGTWDQIQKTLSSNPANPRTPYRPVAALSFALNYYLGKLRVGGYHAANILIHLISSVFLYLFLFNTLRLPSQERRYGSIAYPVALLSTVLWAANPVQTQAVTYIVQRMTSLAGMFYIMAMYLYLKARTGDGKWRNTLLLVMCFFSYVLAFGSKENAAILPIALLMFEVLVIQEDPGTFFRKHKWRLALVLGGTLLLALGYLHVKRGGVLAFLSGYGARPFSLDERLLTEPRVFLFYISLLLYPVPGRLNISHTIDISTSLFSPISTFFSLAVIAGMVLFLLAMARKHNLLSFCGLFFFLNHIMESTVFPLELIYEHRNYVPSMLFFVPIAILLWWIYERYTSKKGMKLVILSAMALLVVGFGHGTFVRNLAWKSEETLWRDALEKAPNQFRAHNNLGVYYKNTGYPEKAATHFEKALNRPPMHRRDENLVILYHLGNLYNEGGNHGKAEFYYQKILQQNPNFAPALANMASIHQLRGEKETADSFLKRAYRVNANDPHINMNMGLYHLHDRRPEKALYHFRISMRDKRLEKR